MVPTGAWKQECASYAHPIRTRNYHLGSELNAKDLDDAGPGARTRLLSSSSVFVLIRGRGKELR